MRVTPEVITSRFGPTNRRKLSAPGFRTFLAIADLWKLTEVQCLLVVGYPTRRTYHNWRKRAGEHRAFTLNVDTLTRISAVLGIHQRLGILFSAERAGIKWLRTPNSVIIFGASPPLDLVTCGTLDGLLTVCQFLDGVLGDHLRTSGPDWVFMPYEDAEIVIR